MPTVLIDDLFDGPKSLQVEGGKRIARVEHLIAYEVSFMSISILAKGFALVYEDGERLETFYHVPMGADTYEAMKKQGRLKVASREYPNVETLLAHLVGEMRRDGLSFTTLAAKKYEAERKAQRAAARENRSEFHERKEKKARRSK